MLMSIFLHGLNLFVLFLNWCRLSIADFNYQVELLLSLYLLSLFIFWSGCYFSGLSFLCDFLDIHFIFFFCYFYFLNISSRIPPYLLYHFLCKFYCANVRSYGKVWVFPCVVTYLWRFTCEVLSRPFL